MKSIGESIADIIAETSSQAAELSRNNEQFTDNNGLKRCRNCGELLETYISIPSISDERFKVSCICSCVKKKQEALAARYKRLELQSELPKKRLLCFKSPSLCDVNFNIDDSPESPGSRIARQWVNSFKPGIRWLFFYGGFGTGKTFLAACIANAMLERGYSVRMLTPMDIESEVFSAVDKAAVYENLANLDLLVIDDLFADRRSDYLYEIITKVINDRYLSDKAVIITSNISKAEAAEPSDVRLMRIMSRIHGKSTPVFVQGGDRRRSQGGWNFNANK